MKLLAIDTSSDACSAALMLEGRMISRFQIAPRRHADILLPMLDDVLDEAGIQLTQLDALAVGCGPGAFTGLRIAAGVIQGLAFAADLPVARISTLTALAQRGRREFGSDKVLCGFDARLGEVYWSACVLTDEEVMVPTGDECVCRPDEVPQPDGGGWLGLGSAWQSYQTPLVKRLNLYCHHWHGDCYPQAEDIAVLGAHAHRNGQSVSAEQALPVYLRNTVVDKPSSAGGRMDP
jgi:tRNA threonylcarbamoyladenosine biosynthesis protein TsaB